MEKMIAMCGLTCSECPAFLATQKDDLDEKKKVAELWSKQFKMEMKPEDITCDGCVSGSSRLSSYCRVCEIRKCGQEKRVRNCASCSDFACEKLNAFFTHAPNAKAALEEIKESF